MIVPFRIAVATLTAIAFATPGAQASAIMVRTCSGKLVRIPADKDPPGNRDDCCDKACHAAGDRKRKASQTDCC